MHFTVEAQKIASQHLSRGDIAVDATCGNGYDTFFLAEQVGTGGVVYGIDLQPEAILVAQRKLAEVGLLANCRLITGSHAELKSILEPNHIGRVSVIMFNLGYLPFGDKSFVTKPDSTLAALGQSIEVVRSGGLISVLAYPGHPGGAEESACVQDWIEKHVGDLEVDRYQDEKNVRSPILWALTVR